MMKLSPLDIQHQEFNHQPFGYNRKQVRNYLENISQAFATQLAEVNHLQQELLKQAEEIERLRLREDALEKDRDLFENYRFAEVENAEKELENLRKRAEDDIELQRQQFATEMAKQKAQAYKEIRDIRESREGSLHSLREERDALARDISLLRQLRSKSVRHMQLFQQQSQLLLSFVEDTSQGLEPPPALLEYLDIATVPKTEEQRTEPPLPSQDSLASQDSINLDITKHAEDAKDTANDLSSAPAINRAIAPTFHALQEPMLTAIDNMTDNRAVIHTKEQKEIGAKESLSSSNPNKAKPLRGSKDKIRYKSLYSALNAQASTQSTTNNKRDNTNDTDDGVVIDIHDEKA